VGRLSTLPTPGPVHREAASEAGGPGCILSLSWRGNFSLRLYHDAIGTASAATGSASARLSAAVPVALIQVALAASG
jgi:hypothetical protein